MKTSILKFISCLIATVIVVGFNSRAVAGPAPVDLLRQAYVTLAAADHDYKGHRVEAMKQIHAAARLLGLNLHGEGKGHEKQGVSDEQLRAAQALLQQASTSLSGKPLKHVQAAEKQISVALSIR